MAWRDLREERKSQARVVPPEGLAPSMAEIMSQAAPVTWTERDRGAYWRNLEQYLNRLKGLADITTTGYYRVGDKMVKVKPEDMQKHRQELIAETTKFVLQYRIAPQAIEGMQKFWTPKVKGLVNRLITQEAQRRKINLAKPAYVGKPEIKPGLRVDLDELLGKKPKPAIEPAKPLPTVKPEIEREIIRKPPGKIIKETPGEPLIKKVYPQENFQAGFNVLKGIDDVEEAWRRGWTKAGKSLWEKARPLVRQTVELTDEAGGVVYQDFDKPWWTRMKSVFNLDKAQQKAVNMINKAKNEIARSTRLFHEQPVIKELYQLTPEERLGIMAIGEGRACPTNLFSPKAHRVLQGLRNLGVRKEIELLNFAKQQGLNLTDEMMVARKAQGLQLITGENVQTLVDQGMVKLDDLIYFRHFRQKYFKDWMGKFLKYPIRKWRWGAIKKSKGTWYYVDDMMNDPAITVPVQNAEATEGMVRWRLIDDVKKTLGKPIPKSGEILPGYSVFEPKGHLRFYPVETATGKQALAMTTRVERFQIPSPVKQELDSFLGKAGGLDKAFRMTWDKATNVWRTSVLALSPRWVLYNTLGNTTLNALGEVSPKSYWKTIKLFRQADNIMRTQKISFRSAMEQLGVSDDVLFGLYEAEAGAALRNLGVNRYGAQTTLRKIGDYAGWVPNKVYRINSRIEDFYRTAHYLDKMAKGFTHEKALKSVNEFLFNYSNLSWTERSIIRRIIPFYSWTKNISRLAITYPAKHPIRTAALGLGAKVGTDYLRDNYGVLIDWGRNEVKLPAGDGETYYVLRMRGMNPFADIVHPLDLFDTNGLTRVLAKVNPIIKIPLERATKTQIVPWGAQEFTTPVTKKDEYGREVRALPSLPRHILTQFPQYQLGEQLAKPYKTYTATGEPIIGKGGRVYPRNEVLDILRMLGLNLATEDVSKVEQRKLKKEYNDLRYEAQIKYYKKKKEIVLENWEQFKELSEQKPRIAEPEITNWRQIREGVAPMKPTEEAIPKSWRELRQ